jgi:hypothetical protein
MGRNAIFIGLAVLVALALVPAAGASAAVKPLTEERATVLATKLGRQVAKERNVRYWRIQRLVKKRTNRFVFEYFERLRTDDRFCKASVIVEQRGTRRTARLTGSRCGTIRADALATEDAVGEALGSLLPKVPEVRAANEAHSREIEDCEALDVPERWLDEVDRFLELGTESVLYERVAVQLDAFATRLTGIETNDGTLARGAASWRKHLEIVASVPEATREPCPVLLEWERDGFSEASRPNFAQTDALHRSLVRHGRRILDAADRLYLLGVSERTFAASTPYGMLVTAAVEYDRRN